MIILIRGNLIRCRALPWAQRWVPVALAAWVALSAAWSLFPWRTLSRSVSHWLQLDLCPIGRSSASMFPWQPGHRSNCWCSSIVKLPSGRLLPNWQLALNIFIKQCKNYLIHLLWSFRAPEFYRIGFWLHFLLEKFLSVSVVLWLDLPNTSDPENKIYLVVSAVEFLL